MNKNLGILLAVSSLPSNHGIGDFGKSCFRFIDWLKDHEYKYWQVLPLNPVGPGYSPYMCSSSNAIDYRYVSLDMLKDEGLLDKVPNHDKYATHVDYKDVLDFKKKYLYKAFLRFRKLHQNKIDAFKKKEPWVVYYASFVVFKEINDGKTWNEWDPYYMDYYKSHKNPPKELMKRIDFIVFTQLVAKKQWMKVLRYARKNNIAVICDMPFYVGFDGVEVWLHRDQFSIDENNKLYEVGGVGPDAFSDIGQLWGTPIYNFDKMKEDGYKLLVDRIGYLASLCDYLRLDHFRAFDTYYVIPAEEETARNGEWKIGPRDDFFNKLYAKYPNLNLIAEDLGDLRPEVLELRDQFNLPGMFISEFTIFDLNNLSTNRQIVYPGTHDNETLWGWYNNLNDGQKDFIANRLNCHDRERLYDEIVKYIFTIPSLMTIYQMQDILKLGNEARMNEPGTYGDPNWTWKLRDFSWEKHVIYPDYNWFK